MAESSTERFLRMLNEQNARIAALQAGQPETDGEDPVRLERDAERREKWGTLRAREHPSRRPVRSYNVFPHVDPS